MTKCAAYSALLLSLLFSSAGLAQDNPFAGTWKLNLEKSKFETDPAPKSMDRIVTVDGDVVKYSLVGIHADGSSFAYSFMSSYDGQESPVDGSGTPGGANSITIRRITYRRHEAIWKKDGKELLRSFSEVSADGKTTVVSRNGRTSQGREYHARAVYDKQ